jgi:hypothetical protein
MYFEAVKEILSKINDPKTKGSAKVHLYIFTYLHHINVYIWMYLCIFIYIFVFVNMRTCIYRHIFILSKINDLKTKDLQKCVVICKYESINVYEYRYMYYMHALYKKS